MTRKYLAVRFTKRFANYDEGTIATFDEERSLAMVKGNVAEFVDAKLPSAETENESGPKKGKRKPCQAQSPDTAF